MTALISALWRNGSSPSALSIIVNDVLKGMSPQEGCLLVLDWTKGFSATLDDVCQLFTSMY